jgi:hypothetical protein
MRGEEERKERKIILADICVVNEDREGVIEE